MIASSERRGLIGNHRICKSTASDAAAAVPDGGDGLISILAHVDAVLAGLQQAEGYVWSIDLVVVIVVDVTHAHDQRTLRQADLRGAVVEGEKSDSGLGAQTDCRRTDVNFRAGIFVGPQIIASHHGAVRHAGDPVVFASRAK